MKPKKIMIFGLIFLIVSIVGAIFSFYVIIENPGEVAVETLYFDESDEDSSIYFIPIFNTTGLSKTVYLEKDGYEFWYEAELFGLGGPQELTIHDSDGNIIYRKSSIFGGSDSIKRNGKDYRKFCSFDIEKSGNYMITVDNPCTLYITPQLHLGLGVGLGYMFVIFGIISVIIMIVGAGLYFTKEKKPLKTHQAAPPSSHPGQFPQYPYYPTYPGYPGYNYPPPPQPPESPQPEARSSDSSKKLKSKPTTKKPKTTSKPTVHKTSPPGPTSEHLTPSTTEPPPHQPPYPPQPTPYPYYYYPYYNYDPYYYYYHRYPPKP